ncbi:MAG: hypothetical protein WA148_02830 [Actinomycetota bacterium]
MIFGVGSPVSAGTSVPALIGTGWEGKLGGKIQFVESTSEIVKEVQAHIDKKRQALGIYGIGGREDAPKEIEKGRNLRWWQQRLRSLLQQQ